MTAHWIEVIDGKWKMRAEVIGFKALSGAHSGENLGRYAVGLLDRVGIMSEKTSKVHFLTGVKLVPCVRLIIHMPALYRYLG
jgi:hypothetical protein